jgi:hypothetical protein
MMADTARMPTALNMTFIVPNTSTILPVSGEKANIPTVCAEITRPTTSRPRPVSSMWIGVPVIISTITTWPKAIETTAT